MILSSGARAANAITETPSDHRAAVVAGFLGWTLDAFDFFIVVVTLTAIGKEFHVSDREMAKTLAVTLAFRPIGALIFGVLADRYGRRIPLMINLVFYSVHRGRVGARHFVHDVLLAARPLRNRHGRRVGRGRDARDGEGAGEAARRALGTAAGGLRDRKPSRVRGVFPHLPALGMAATLLPRRTAGAARDLRAHAREGVGGVAAHATPRLQVAGSRDRLAVAALSLPHTADGVHERRVARHAGSLSDVPPA